MSLRVAVTGSSGFIGRHVAAALAARGDLVMPLRRPFDVETLTASLHGVHAVVHLAGVVSAVRERDFAAGNVDATRIVAQASRNVDARLVHVSSLAAAGPAPVTAPRSEDDEPAPITAYGRTKLEGERIVSGADGLRWMILRPGVVYGPGDRAMRPLFRWARLGVLPIVGRADAAYTFIYIDDAVRAILAAVDSPRHGETIFLGHAQPVTARQLLEQIRSTIGSSTALVPVPRPIIRGAAALGDVAGLVSGKPATINANRYAELYAPGFVCRVDRMRDRLGVVADTDLAAGLARARSWYLT